VTDTSTRTRLLDAAEPLLREQGYEAVSVRAINSAAGVNPAAVHYHFGSKEELVAALLEDRLAPLWEQELAALVERNETPTVAELVDVVLGPFERGVDPLHVYLLARIVLGRRQVDWASRWFRLTPWVDLLLAAHPELSAQQARRRWMLAFDLILHVAGAPLAERPGDGPGDLAVLRTFVTAGLDA
jgi:AcrR family transcriptional regulator